MKKYLAIGVIAVVAVLLFSAASLQGPKVVPPMEANYQFDKEGNLLRPEGYREWVYIGTPLTPNDMNPPEAAFPEFHNVYIHPDDFDHYEKTGKFRDGTIMVKELVTVGSKKAVSGNGYFMGEFIGLEATIKDSKQFPNEPGNWAYFSFGHSYPLMDKAAAFPTNACNSCHQASAADDFVFTQYYPILRSAKGSKDSRSGMRSAVKPSDVATSDMKNALDEMGITTGGLETSGEIPPAEKVAILKWLQEMPYQNWYAESTIHPSRGPHEDVKIFYNDILKKSLQAGSKEHPVGATAVKEMYKDGKHLGWAVETKTQAASNYGDGLYWYETLDPRDPAKLAFEGMGVSLCAGCHNGPGNKDLVLGGYPLK